MRLDASSSGSSPATFPGVYSTSFGVQLLCRRDAPADPKSRQAILDGLKYLLLQFDDSKRVDAGDTQDCKQARKFKEVGHHDFKLTMKLGEVLEAANALWDIRNTHPEFAKALEDSYSQIDEIARVLANAAISSDDQGQTFRAWPWHVVTESAEADPIPTCHALMALTHQACRTAVNRAEVVNYLLRELENESVFLVHKVRILNSLLRLEYRIPGSVNWPGKRDDLLSEIRARLREPATLAWQESLHYSIPSAEGPISHYKPWIWTFPRIDAAECCLRLKESRAGEVTETLAELVQNASRDIGLEGAVHFQVSEAPSLLASLRTSTLFRLANEVLLSSRLARVKLRTATVHLRIVALARRHPGFITSFFALWIFVTVLPHTDFTSAIGQLSPSLDLLSRSLRALRQFWPIWAVAFAVTAVWEQGPIWRRLIRATAYVATVVLMATLVSMALPV